MTQLLHILLIVSIGSPFLDSLNVLKEGTNIPDNFVKEYIDSTFKEDRFYRTYTLYKKSPFDSLNFVNFIYEVNTGVCNYKYLAILDSSGNRIDQIELSLGCDHDGANPVMESIDYEIKKSENKVVVYYKVESVKSKYLDDKGNIKNNKSFWDLETETKIEVINYMIDKSGKINII